MKQICTFFCWACFAFYCNAQNKGVIREVDSLVQLSRDLLPKGKFDESLKTIEYAEALAKNTFGPNDSLYAKCLYNHGRTLYQKREYQQAERYYIDAMTIQASVLQYGHENHLGTLSSLGILYRTTAKYDQAEKCFRELLDIAEKTSGKESRTYALGLSSLAILYRNTYKFDKAESAYLEALGILEKVAGKEDEDYITVLGNLAVLYKNNGDYAKAEPLYLEAIKYRSLQYGEESLAAAKVMYNLATLYVESDKYEKAEYYLQKVLKTRKKILGVKHPDYLATSLIFNIIYINTGQFEKAKISTDSIIDVYQKNNITESLDYAATLNEAGILYRNLGEYHKAEAYYLESKSIKERVSGTNNESYVSALNNLAVVYDMMGEYKKAEEYQIHALKVREKTLGKQHQEYGLLLYNLAAFYDRQGKFKLADSLARQARAIFSLRLDKSHNYYARLIGLMGKLQLKQNNISEAIHLFSESKQLFESRSSQKTPDYLQTLIHLSLAREKQMEYDSAITILLTSKQIHEEAGLLKSRDFVKTLFQLSKLYTIKKDFAESQKYALDCSRFYIDRTQEYRDYLTGPQLNALIKSSDIYINNWFFSLFPLVKNLSSTFRQAAFGNTLFYKGLLLESTQSINRSIAVAPDSIRLIHASWQGYHRRLATEYAKPLAERRFVGEMEARADSLEKILVRSVAGFADARRRIEWSDVQKSLQSGEAAVEFVRFQYYNPELTDSVLYGALVLRPGEEAPQFITLFEKNDVTALMQGVMGSNFTKINAAYRPTAGKSLYDFIWKPIEPYLQGIKTVYCSPSGLLHSLNIGSLAVNDRETVADRRRIILLGSTRQLATRSKRNGAYNTSAYLAGGIRYSMDSTAIVSANSNRTRGLPDNDGLKFDADSTTRSNSWNYLPESATEVAEIGKLLHKSGLETKVDTSYFASEEAFRSLGVSAASPRIIHLSTHGFFFPDPQKNSKNPFPDITEEPVFKTSEHPMVRSGLLMAGANQAWQTGKKVGGLEDGILTAYEISQMDLSGTELVVLSACETGLGDIEGNEGVYGLQRAFKIAGAKDLIMSLWKVNDQSTRELMTEFYRQWLEKGQTIPDAFTAAQKTLRKKYPDAPYHWAGFVLVE
ncbi:MAG: CHAT domain-containing protein [Saprospiraceae bacterium]|nr:CHAT domain-containing protein [Saprospiraceae bacterium]